jgi:hypothetical protein
MIWKIGDFLLDDRVKLFYTVGAYQLNSNYSGVKNLIKSTCFGQESHIAPKCENTKHYLIDHYLI